MKFENKRLIGILVAGAFMLLTLFTAMKIGVEGLKWSWFDFALAGTLLLGVGLACEFSLRMFKTMFQRITVCAVALLLLVIVWVEMAVGIFGTPIAGN